MRNILIAAMAAAGCCFPAFAGDMPARRPSNELTSSCVLGIYLRGGDILTCRYKALRARRPNRS
jgi:hypothetical protein